MPARYPARYRRRSAPRRTRIWLNTQSDVAFAATQEVNLDLFATDLGGTNVAGYTVLRTLVRVGLPFTAATDRFYVGLLVCKPSDIGTAVAGQANVSGDRDLDWAWRDEVISDSTGGGFGQQVYTIDTKAKRRVPELMSRYALCMWSQNALTAKVFARVLVALP